MATRAQRFLNAESDKWSRSNFKTIRQIIDWCIQKKILKEQYCLGSHEKMSLQSFSDNKTDGIV